MSGLERFRSHFTGWEDHYVLIGGAAASLAFNEQELQFRLTKDLDILLHLESLDVDFMRHFWDFIRGGGYQIRGSEARSKPRFYRFHKPSNQDYPHMIELLCRQPETVAIPDDLHITPIDVVESVSALSAIILDSDYYTFVLGGRRTDMGLSWIDADRLIPLKAHAWLNLVEQQRNGGDVKSTDIKKHHQDVFALVALLDPANPIPAPDRIKDDLRTFISQHQQSDDTSISILKRVYGL